MKRTSNTKPVARWFSGRVVWALLVLAAALMVATAGAAQADASDRTEVSVTPTAPAEAAVVVVSTPTPETIITEPAPAPEALIIPSVQIESSEYLSVNEPITVTVPSWVMETLAADESPMAGEDLEIVKTAETGVEGNLVVFNGSRITYTIVISNPTDAKASAISILDVLPKNSLDSKSIQCSNACTKISDETWIQDPLGGTVLVTTTRQISWEVASLLPGKLIVRTFSGRVVGQGDGTVIKNRAFIDYTLSGVSRSGMSNEPSTIVRVRVDVPGQPNLSSAPTWFSSDQGGTIGMDWGDWNADGYLDLALGSTMGTSVYRNNLGRPKLFWSDVPQAYGVSWADFDRDGELELVTVGDSVNNDPSSPGINYFYNYDLAGEAFTGTQFTSDRQLVRVAPGDYQGDDGYIDLVVGTNSINADCPVVLYGNTMTPTEPFEPPGVCLSLEATAALGPVDYANRDLVDLGLGEFPNLAYLFQNSGIPTATNPYTDLQHLPSPIKGTADYLPYDFAWGDFDEDGFLDLALAFPLERRVRIYRNGARGEDLEPFQEIRTSLFRTPLAVDWGDFDGDGRIDLAVADSPPTIYRYDRTEKLFLKFSELQPDAVTGEVWAMQAVDQDNDGDLDLALTNRDGPSMLFTNFAPLLRSQLSPITFTGASASSSVAWGDADGDGRQDLLFGAGPGAVGAKLFYNDKSEFPSDSADALSASGFGPHSVAWGDVNADHKLDIALAVGISAGIQVYHAENTSSPDWNSAPPHYPGFSVAWGDADDDGYLDLLVGRDGPNALYCNEKGTLVVSPTWVFTETDTTRSVAWGDFDNDRYLDVAVGNDGQNRIYRNNHDYTFSLVWNSAFVSNTTSVAWADYDGDGYLDLAVGNNGEANLIYKNEGGELGEQPIWFADTLSKTTSLAWGDWNNDGDLDLAVGNDGEPDQVYANLTSGPGALPQLYWIWTSAESAQTSSVAWGDADGDGDLDLAVAQRGNQKNGVYENTYIMPSHLVDKFAKTTPLPNNPSYVSIQRPGLTPAAFYHSTSELLSGPTNPTVTIKYKLFDPDGTRDDSSVTNAFGDEIASTSFEFSLDDGATWAPATSISPAEPITRTRRLGQAGEFLWDAVTDEAISDNARFRVRIVPVNPVGPVQRAAISAISPPFRIRGTSCVWPSDPFFSIDSDEPEHGQSLRFEGGVLKASNVLTYTWDFGDNTEPSRGQVVNHTFRLPGTYRVVMTVRSEPCPLAKEVVAVQNLYVAPGPTTVYLPMIMKRAKNEGEEGTLMLPPPPLSSFGSNSSDH